LDRLSNEVLRKLVQVSAKLPEVKHAWIESGHAADFFSDLQLLNLAVVQFLELQGCIVSYLIALILEQLDIAKKKKEVGSTLRYFSPFKEP